MQYLIISTANCGVPELLSTVSNDSVPNIVGYDNHNIIPVEGSIVTFSCPPGLVLNGSNSATCTENGEWEPDPSRLTCNDSISKNLMSTFLIYSSNTNARTFLNGKN